MIALIVAPVALVVFSGLTLAQSMGTQVTPNANADAPASFGQIDANRDGSISPAEAAANPRLSGTFLSLDANGNGALEPSEFSRFEVTGAATTRGTPGTPPASTGTPPPATSTPPPMGSTPPPNRGTPAR